MALKSGRISHDPAAFFHNVPQPWDEAREQFSERTLPIPIPVSGLVSGLALTMV